MAKHERDVKREEYWRGVLTRHVASGLTIRAFCRREQLTESAFFAWRRTIAAQDAEAEAQTGRGGRSRRPAFLPVVVEGDSHLDAAITLELAGGRVLRLPAATPTERLVELVQALEARGTNNDCR